MMQCCGHAYLLLQLGAFLLKHLMLSAKIEKNVDKVLSKAHNLAVASNEVKPSDDEFVPAFIHYYKYRHPLPSLSPFPFPLSSLPSSLSPANIVKILPARFNLAKAGVAEVPREHLQVR